ncbi:MAG: FKBP-type peptidyl-prolyl cis-trans isomerase [Bacteroidales bacterium]|jgi:FKBP-type peptidyl-prolyl cis-trans isomerase|nr:hypothetical protein [Bacteroidales bacterium]
MKKVTSILSTIVCLIILTTACGDKKLKDYKETKSGLKYKFETENPKAQQAQIGDVLIAEMKITFNDSVLFDNLGEPTRLFMVKESDFEGDLYEGLRMMHVGDAATFAISADSIAKMGAQMPPFYKAGNSEIVFYYIKVQGIVTAAELDKERQEQEALLEIAKNSEQDSINAYIQRNNIKQKPTESGLYYIETLKGTGSKIDIGKTITINYTGKLLNGTVFDSSLEEGREPLEFVLEEGRMIKGFTEGLLKMREKGKATLIIPSNLAYGIGNPQSPIPPYATLIFDIEVLNVK